MPARPSPTTTLAAALVGFGLAAASAASSPSPALGAPAAKPHGKDGKATSGKAGSKSRKEEKKSGRAPTAPPAAAENPAPQPSAPAEPPLKLAIERLTLENGLRVVLCPWGTSPTVAVAVTYEAGARYEAPGQSGLARLLARLMFQGSKNVGPGEHARLVAERGGVATGEAHVDEARFVDVLPAGELALGLFLEADRMKSLDLGDEGLTRARAALAHELSERSHTRPPLAFAPSGLRLRELVYQGYFPYEHPPLGGASGAPSDLASLPLDAVKDFHARRYGPASAVLTITGDFDPHQAADLVHRYFDGVPKAEIAPPDASTLPEQTSQRTAVMRDPSARAPAILYGFAVPEASSKDHHALDLAAIMLGGGESSRLYQSLVRDRAIAQVASAETHGLRGPDLFSVDVELGEEAKVGEVEKLIEGEIKALAVLGPSEAELDKARRQMQSRLLLALESSPRRAALLGDYELFWGDARRLEGEIPTYLAVTRDDVKRAVAQHLGPTRRSIVETYPTSVEPPKESAAPPPREALAAPAPASAHKGGKGTAEHKTKKGAPTKAKKPRKDGG